MLKWARMRERGLGGGLPAGTKSKGEGQVSHRGRGVFTVRANHAKPECGCLGTEVWAVTTIIIRRQRKGRGGVGPRTHSIKNRVKSRQNGVIGKRRDLERKCEGGEGEEEEG